MKKLVMSLVVAVAAFAAQANPDGYVMVALCSPGELPTPESNIHGLRLSLIYGDCQRLNGLDFGVTGAVRERINGAQINALFSLDYTDMNGFGLGCVNYVGGEFDGFQLGLWDHAGSGAGFQLGLVDTAGAFDGFQLGLINWSDDLAGFQLGLWNHAGIGAGFQLGLVNTAGTFAGFQLGLFNWADSLAGLQIGLSNVAVDQEEHVWLPILNMGW